MRRWAPGPHPPALYRSHPDRGSVAASWARGSNVRHGSSPGSPRGPKAQRRGNARMRPRPTRLECFARLPWVVVSLFGRGQRGKSHSAVKKVRNTVARLASSLLPLRDCRTRTTYRNRRHRDEASTVRIQLDCPPLLPPRFLQDELSHPQRTSWRLLGRH